MGRPAYDTKADMKKALAAIDEGRETRVELRDDNDAAHLRANLPVSTDTVDDVDELLDELTRDPNECGCRDDRCDDLCGPVEADGMHYRRDHGYGPPFDDACRHARACPADRHYIPGSAAVLEPSRQARKQLTGW